jgi:hypothetical protein
MRTFLLASLIVTLSVVIGIGSAAADSTVNYPDTSRSQAIDLGGGQHAFVFFDIPGDNDIFIHPVTFAANLLLVNLQGFVGFAIWLDFEGFNGQFMQFGVYTCNGGPPCGFGNPPIRRGTFFL